MSCTVWESSKSGWPGEVISALLSHSESQAVAWRRRKRFYAHPSVFEVFGAVWDSGGQGKIKRNEISKRRGEGSNRKLFLRG
jgi:hypothetical protein